MKKPFMHDQEEVKKTLAFKDEGLNYNQISKLTGINRSTVRGWLRGERKSKDEFIGSASKSCNDRIGSFFDELKSNSHFRSDYYYLLGQYLGDGHIVKTPRSYKLRIFSSDCYGKIYDKIVDSIFTITNNKVNYIQKQGCKEVYVYSSIIPTLFPQYGPGKKHTRKIELTDWQLDNIDYASLLKGLLQSDGCYYYSRGAWLYNFVNCSLDIINIYRSCLDNLNIEHRFRARGMNNRVSQAYVVTVSKKDSVIKMYDLIGSKKDDGSDVPQPSKFKRKITQEVGTAEPPKPILTKIPYVRPTKIAWPPDDVLSYLVSTYPALALANKLGVSDKAIAKRCARKGITRPTTSYWQKMNNKQILELKAQLSDLKIFHEETP